MDINTRMAGAWGQLTAPNGLHPEIRLGLVASEGKTVNGGVDQMGLVALRGLLLPFYCYSTSHLLVIH
jgi:hypothetical protein